MASTASKGATEYIIVPADFSSPSLLDLLEAHTAWCTAPGANVPGDVHYALDLAELKKPGISLFCCWEMPGSSTAASDATLSSADLESSGALLVGCAALRVYSPRDFPHPSEDPDALEGEVKTMHTLSSRRGKGIGKMMLDHVIEEARRKGIKVIKLETGTTEGFAGTRLFYERCGFRECGVFAGYKIQANSTFMERRLGG